MLNKAYIDLIALRGNAKRIKSKLKKSVRFCAVVKADAYGHGASEVASALYGIVDCYAVAIVEEGIALRLSGIKKDVLVLTPVYKEDVQRAIYYDLTLTASNMNDLKIIKEESNRQNRIVRVHLKYNTGMNRQGADSLEELKAMLDFCAKTQTIDVEGMYSHFAFPENKKVNNAAVNKFLLANNLVKGYNNNAICHISASGGFLTGVQADMVRIGLLLYGYKPFPSEFISVKPIMKVFAPVINRRRVKKGESALYGAVRTTRDLDLALVRYGYADGLFRKRIDGQFNNRCMDLTALTDLNEEKRGVPIMTDADVLAKEYQTISYEILTKAALRAEKIYLR